MRLSGADLAFTFAVILFAFAIAGTVMLPSETDVIEFRTVAAFFL